jgi:four helix bundle protein
MSKVSHFRELRVWQGGMDVVEAIYRLSAVFPKSELYGLTSQIRRAAVSVPSNIAEGLESSSVLGRQLYKLRDALVARI